MVENMFFLWSESLLSKGYDFRYGFFMVQNCFHNAKMLNFNHIAWNKEISTLLCLPKNATFSTIYLNSQKWKWLLPNLMFGVTLEILVGVGLTLWNSFLLGTNFRSFCFTYTRRLLLPGICHDNAFVTVIHLIFALLWQSDALYSTFLTCILAFYQIFSLSWRILVSIVFIL